MPRQLKMGTIPPENFTLMRRSILAVTREIMIDRLRERYAAVGR